MVIYWPWQKSAAVTANTGSTEILLFCDLYDLGPVTLPVWAIFSKSRKREGGLPDFQKCLSAVTFCDSKAGVCVFEFSLHLEPF